VPSFSQRLLPVLQLTRMALVFTALADSGCAMLLSAHFDALSNGHSLWKQLYVIRCIGLMMISIGLYGFGMSLNDIIDRRRDRQISPTRPLPSGSIGLATAHVVCTLLVMIALLGAELYSNVGNGSRISLVLTVLTMALIAFYDFAARYFVPVGLLSLGFIRFFHAMIAEPTMPVVWHPLLLLNHVTIVSAIAHHLEQKRPRIRRMHFRWVMAGLGAIDLATVVIVTLWKHQIEPRASVAQILALQPALLGPFAAVLAFVVFAVWSGRRSTNRRDAGQALNLAGLLWLIVYDAAFSVGFAGVLAGSLILLLLPVAYLAVWVVGWWGKLIQLSQRPTFRRVET